MRRLQSTLYHPPYCDLDPCCFVPYEFELYGALHLVTTSFTLGKIFSCKNALFEERNKSSRGNLNTITIEQENFREDRQFGVQTKTGFQVNQMLGLLSLQPAGVTCIFWN